MAVTRSQTRSGGRSLSERELPARRRRWNKRYKDTDVAKRHRLPDRQSKTEVVTTYKRRRA